MNTLREESHDLDENVQTRIDKLEDELYQGHKLASKPGFEFVQKSFERAIRQFYTIISLPNIDILDIEELEEKKHRAFTMLVEMSEKEANTIDISSTTFDYVASANEEMFRKFQDEKFVHAYKKVYQNPQNNTIKDFLQEDMRKNILSLLNYRKNQIRSISKAEEAVKGAVEKIARLNTIPELYADLAIKEAANDMIFEQAISKGEKNGNQKIEIQETSFFSKIKAGIRRWF